MSTKIKAVYSWALLLWLILGGCQSRDLDYFVQYRPFSEKFAEATGYDLLKPNKTYLLPDILTEISGLTMFNDSTVACVQDEAGWIYFFGLNEGKILDKLRFSGNGDYEGIAIVQEDIFVLKNTGKLYQYSITDQTTNTINTPLKGSNNAEGLAYDPIENQLLMACKSKAGLNGERIRGKAVYGYHLTAGFKSAPLYLITAEDLLVWNNQQEIPMRLSERRMGFMPSGIALHPHTGDVYIIASAGKLLFVLSKAGEIKHCVPISPRIFRQPEGICFTSSGDLIISNEGQDGNAKIQLFKWNKPMTNPNTSADSLSLPAN